MPDNELWNSACFTNREGYSDGFREVLLDQRSQERRSQNTYYRDNKKCDKCGQFKSIYDFRNAGGKSYIRVCSTCADEMEASGNFEMEGK